MRRAALEMRSPAAVMAIEVPFLAAVVWMIWRRPADHIVMHPIMRMRRDRLANFEIPARNGKVGRASIMDDDLTGSRGILHSAVLRLRLRLVYAVASHSCSSSLSVEEY